MDEPCQRLFVALWPDKAVRRQLWALARNQAPRSARLTHLEDLHLTLRFLGAVPEQKVTAVQEALRQVSGPCFELALTHTGYWSRPRVWWCAPDEVPSALQLLVKALDTALKPVGFKPESRPYRAHVTLARKIKRATGEALPDPILWHAKSFDLVESRTVAEPPRYRLLHTWPLGN